MEDKISQTVNHGSVLIALEENFFTPIDLLEWLSANEVTENTHLAYHCLCNYIHPNEHYIKDNRHIFLLKPEYALFKIVDIDQTLISVKGDNLSPPLFSIVNILHQDKSFLKLMMEITGLIAVEIQKCEEILTKAFKIRMMSYFEEISTDDRNFALIQSEWLEHLNLDNFVPVLIIKRIKFLKQNAPLYFDLVKEKYRKLFEMLFEEHLLDRLSVNSLKYLHNEFPEILNENIFECTPARRKLTLMPTIISGYILGFPIQSIIPLETQIKDAITLYENLGVVKYSEYIKTTCTQTSRANSTPFDTEEIVFSNETDFLLENIDSYVPFDIVSFRSGKFIYRFTRPEFEKIIESRKNPWTNEDLPIPIIHAIVSRVNTAKELNLPPPMTVKDMFDRLAV